MTQMDKKITDTARIIKNSKKMCALTGAGISAESGIDPFRGKNGIWNRYDPEEYAHIDSFMRNPGKVWVMLKELLAVINSAEPNLGHKSLARLEEMGFLKSIITQNVDGLHQAGGSKKVIEFHGSNAFVLCMECGKKYNSKEISCETLPPKCACGGILRPDVVFFGEQIPPKALSESFSEARSCDVMLVIGTSALVTPAADIPVAAKENGAKIIEINPERTPLSIDIADITIEASAGRALPAIIEAIERT